MGDFYTVKECAQMLEVSPQAIYKRLYHDKSGGFVQDHVFTINGKKFIDEELMKFFMREKRIIENKSKDPVISEIDKILSQLTENNKKKVLKAAKQIFEVQKYE